MDSYCNKCGETKPLYHFYKKTLNKCIDCIKGYNEQYKKEGSLNYSPHKSYGQNNYIRYSLIAKYGFNVRDTSTKEFDKLIEFKKIELKLRWKK